MSRRNACVSIGITILLLALATVGLAQNRKPLTLRFDELSARGSQVNLSGRHGSATYRTQGVLLSTGVCNGFPAVGKTLAVRKVFEGFEIIGVNGAISPPNYIVPLDGAPSNSILMEFAKPVSRVRLTTDAYVPDKRDLVRLYALEKDEDQHFTILDVRAAYDDALTAPTNQMEVHSRQPFHFAVFECTTEREGFDNLEIEFAEEETERSTSAIAGSPAKVATDVPQAAVVKPANEAPAWLLQDWLTADKRRELAAVPALALKVLPHQRERLDSIAAGRAVGAWADAFPYWELQFAPGVYHVDFQSSGALWRNRIVVGTEVEFGKGFQTVLGEIDNQDQRRHRVSFSLAKPTIIRIEGQTNQPGAGLHNSHLRKFAEIGALWIGAEDGFDVDFDDLVVRITKVTGNAAAARGR